MHLRCTSLTGFGSFPQLLLSETRKDVPLLKLTLHAKALTSERQDGMSDAMTKHNLGVCSNDGTRAVRA